MQRRTLSIEPRLRILAGDEALFGPGKAELLKHIAETGSIRSAAERLQMSYNRAWGLVKQIEHSFKAPVVVVKRGGDTGGGAVLTALGAEILLRYSNMEASCRKALEVDWKKLRKHIKQG